MTVGNRHDAEDLTTQTFMRMLESIGKFRFQSAPFSAWLFRIAHNLSMDHFRANKRWQPEEEVPEPHGSEERSAEDEAFQSIGRQSMLELIDSLSHGAAAGTDAQVRLQLLQRRGGDDPRQDRGRGEVAAAPRAGLAAEADLRRRGGIGGARGRDRRPAGRGQDDAVHGVDEDRRRRLRQGERRHGLDRGRPARAARRARRRPQDHARDDPGRRRPRDRAGTARRSCVRSMRSSPSPTASPPGRIRQATWRHSSWSCSSPTGTTSSGGWSGSRSRRSPAMRRCARRSSSCRRCSHTSTRATRSGTSPASCPQSWSR